MTVLEWVHPDIETHLRSVLGAGTRGWVTDSEWKHPYWVIVYTVRVESGGTSKSAANDAGHDADAAMRALPHLPWQDGFVLGVDVVDAPAWAPRTNGAPVYAATYRVICRPRGTTP